MLIQKEVACYKGPIKYRVSDSMIIYTLDITDKPALYTFFFLILSLFWFGGVGANNGLLQLTMSTLKQEGHAAAWTCI